MFNSIDVLKTFVHAAELGSFSAAARRLGKSQSTVSEAISNLEIDAGLVLFDRSKRQPQLTPAGVQLLAQARHLLASHDALKQQARTLQQGLESQLTIVLSDTFQSLEFEALLSAFADKFPLLQLECLVGEDQDVLALLASNRAQLGLIRAQGPYNADISYQAVPGHTDIALFVSQQHPLAQIAQPNQSHLSEYRELMLSSYSDSPPQSQSPICWLAPSYLLLLEMTLRGFGWAALPTWLVQSFGKNQLHMLDIAGWPRQVHIDLIWSRNTPLGPAASWLTEQFLRGK